MKGHGFSALAAAGLLLVSGAAFAQEPVVGVKDPAALFHSSDPKLDANKQVVYHIFKDILEGCLLYTSPSPRDRSVSRMPSSA